MQASGSIAETSPRISRTGVFVGLGVAIAALAFSVRAVRPAQRPVDVEQLITTASWWVGAVLTVWLTLSLVTWLIVLDRPGMNTKWLRLVTLPGSRRLAEGMLAVGLLAGCAPASSDVVAPRIEVLRPVEMASTPTTTLVDTGALPSIEVSIPLVSTDSLSSPTTLVDTSQLSSTAPLAPVVVPDQTIDANLSPSAQDSAAVGVLAVDDPVDVVSPSGSSDVGSHDVAEGENFWTIAEARLAQQLGRPATDAEVTPYWVSVVKANAESITSGNPDLIFPGETILLPAVP